jgi:hypothetical protein
MAKSLGAVPNIDVFANDPTDGRSGLRVNKHWGKWWKIPGFNRIMPRFWLGFPLGLSESIPSRWFFSPTASGYHFLLAHLDLHSWLPKDCAVGCCFQTAAGLQIAALSGRLRPSEQIPMSIRNLPSRCLGSVFVFRTQRDGKYVGDCWRNLGLRSFKCPEMFGDALHGCSMVGDSKPLSSMFFFAASGIECSLPFLSNGPSSLPLICLGGQAFEACPPLCTCKWVFLSRLSGYFKTFQKSCLSLSSYNLESTFFYVCLVIHEYYIVIRSY